MIRCGHCGHFHSTSEDEDKGMPRGCLAQDPDFSTIAVSWVDCECPHDPVAEQEGHDQEADLSDRVFRNEMAASARGEEI